MCSSRKFAPAFVRLFAAAAFACAAFGALAASAQPYPGVGRTATPREVEAWDIDVRPDFKGLPAGSGSVAKGQEVWEGKCASCHGVFGESNEVFNPLVGGTTADDVKTGRVAMLMRRDYPGRTTLMKVSQVSTLWDYIRRAMPWTQPKSLTVEEVYAVTAYLLNLGGVVPDDFTLSDRNIAQVQQRLPNRNGTTTQHGLWPGNEFTQKSKPDVQGTTCMKDCAVETKVASTLPAFARNAHGNLAQQNRIVGAQHGVETGAAPAATTSPVALTAPQEVAALTQKNNCIACHAIDRRVVGPSWAEIAQKHVGRVDYLAGKIRSGGSGSWGAIPMPPQTLSDAEARILATWLASGAKP
jgi:S-disulfanyl-L-cysteine oxidoreductase SoxD